MQNSAGGVPEWQKQAIRNTIRKTLAAAQGDQPGMAPPSKLRRELEAEVLEKFGVSGADLQSLLEEMRAAGELS